MHEQDRQAITGRAHEKRVLLADRGVQLVAITWVDNSGVTRVKAVPLPRLESAAVWGIGASPCFDGWLFNDLPAVVGPDAPGAVGDLRLHPDLDRLTVLSAHHGWAWAPADRFDQDGNPHPLDQRTLAKKAAAQLAERGYQAKFAFEVEWVIGEPDDADDFVPAMRGPAYGFARLTDRADYLSDVVEALTEQDVAVEQIHPEYAPGQLELSVAAESPVAAADTLVLVRETIRAVSLHHGLRVSFSPKVLADGVGNGGHVHLSLWRGRENLCAGGDRPCGLTGEAESFAAGILLRLPALLAIGAPSVASYLRLVPQHWAGAFSAWGLENREAAVRMITGAIGSRSVAANLEVKCFDLTANPYLLVAALIFAGLAGLDDDARLPDPVDLDPALLTAAERAARGIRRLPATLAESADAFEADPVLRQGFGDRLVDTIVSIRRAEVAHFAEASPEDIAAAIRWVH